MKILLALLISFLTISASAKTEVIYVNGASADTTWPEKQALAFYEKMKVNGIVQNESIDFSYYPIPQSEVESALGINCQREISRESFPTTNTRPTPTELDQYYKSLGRMYDDMWITALKNPSCNGILILNMYSSVLGLATALKKKIDANISVVVVSYSMGNNYAEAAIAYLYYKGYISSLSKIKLVGIGSPAFTSNGKYINASLDNVVYGTFLLESYSLPATIEYCINPCSRIATYQEILGAGGVSGHILLNDYLNDNFFTWEHKKKVSGVIADRINDLTALPPPTANISIITPSPVAGSGVIFQPNITASPNGAVTEYEWDFGDGTILMGNASQITHIYAGGGTYTVKLKIKDAKGVTNTASTTITVAAGVSIPSITRMTPSDAVVGETRTFTITGENLPTTDHLDVTFNGCANIVFVSGYTANLHRFTCVPQSAGTITAVIRTLPGTQPLGTYSVSVSPAIVANVTPSCSAGVTATRVVDIAIGANQNWGANSCVFSLDGSYGSSDGTIRGYLKLRHSDTHVYALIDLATLAPGFQHWLVYSAPSNDWNSISYAGTAVSMYFNPSGSKVTTAGDFEIGLYPGYFGVTPTGQADYPPMYTGAALPTMPANGEKYSTYTYLARSNKILSNGNWYNTGGMPIGYKLKINSGITENGSTNHIYYEIAIPKNNLDLVQTNTSYLSIDVKYFDGRGAYGHWKIGDATSVFKINLGN